MKVFLNIWNDIRKGENIDLYLTVIAAFGVAGLNYFGQSSSALIASVTLAVLGALAVSSLTIRHKLKGLARTPSVGEIFLEKFPENLNPNIEAAQDVWLVGVALKTPINVFYPMLEQKLRKGHSIKFLLVEPDPEVVQFAAIRSYTKQSIERTCHSITESLENYCELSAIEKGKVRIRTIRYPLDHGIIAINPQSVNGRMYVTNYSFKTKAGSQPKYVVRAEDGYWFDLYKDELYRLWENADEWECKVL